MEQAYTNFDGAEATSLTVFSADRFVRCGAVHEAALRDARTPVDLHSTGSLTRGFANLFPLGGGSGVATTELISALRAHLGRV